MKKKIITFIDTCHECPYFDAINTDTTVAGYCYNDNRQDYGKIEHIDIQINRFPLWCPLEDDKAWGCGDTE